MSEPKLISPLLDNFIIGGPISDHHGVQCCPAMENNSDDRYIVKIISLPANPSQIDALLLTGAYSDTASALSYFKELAEDITNEVNILNKLSELEGFLPYCGCQIEPKESGMGYNIYLLSPYKRSLDKHFKRHAMTHLDALNLGLDLCAALSVCRRSGYLYVDLKPSNVFVTGERLYRIGDLGFIRLDSIKFTSLSEKFFSQYTPPEISDAFSTLNTTMDTYAAGLILYQAYNNGALPVVDSSSSTDAFPPPLYADYEMSEIILKACAPKPEERWQDPMQMGQAIINYMQRNGALDTPIVPVSDPVTEIESSITCNTLATEDTSNETCDEEIPNEGISSDELITEDSTPLIQENVSDSEGIVEEDSTSEEFDLQDLKSDSDDILDEIDKILSEDSPENDTYIDSCFEENSTTYESLTDEVSKILNQADELASITVPEPVIVPEPVDVPIPEPVIPEETSSCDEDEDEAKEISVETADAESPEKLNSIAEETVPVKNRKWLRYIIIIFILLGFLAGGYYYYLNHYLLPIDSITILEGNEESLTVKINTDIDEALLQVVCSDTYGNQIPAPVINGVAEFSGLVPNTAYSINVVANGFHRLTGKTATAYSTPVQSTVVQFDAVTGTTNGSVILSFAIEGPDCEEWTVNYSTDGENTRSATFSAHIVTITDLAVGKEYTFQLIPEQDLYLTGQTEVKFIANNVIKAENLTINSCMNNTLNVSWSAPENDSVLSWSVRCFNENYNETIITTDTFAVFEGIDQDAGYTVEVKAIGMSVSEMVSIPENSVTISNLQINSSDPAALSLTWETNRTPPVFPDGWKLRYWVDGINTETVLTCDQNTCVITPVIPNATYHIQLEDDSGNILLGSTTEITTGDSAPFYWDFDGYDVHTNDLIFKMCKPPEIENWTRFDLTNDSFTTTFSSGEAASFLVQITKQYNASSEAVTTMYVIRNSEGLPIYQAITSDAWMNMWYRNYCELDIPAMPTAAGEYTVEVFFNGGLVVAQPFTIIQ